jgi:hypothetical protein
MSRPLSTSSYNVARRHGLTAAQHYALRIIGGDAPPVLDDIAVVTLRALRSKGLIVQRDPVVARSGFVDVSSTWGEFTVTVSGRVLYEHLGEWRP